MMFLKNISKNSTKSRATTHWQAVFPVMIVCMLVVIIFQVRSTPSPGDDRIDCSARVVGVVPILADLRQPFGFDAILGLIALAGILMRNTLILVGQIKTNRDEGLDTFHPVVEATVRTIKTGSSHGTRCRARFHSPYVLRFLGIR